MTRPRVLCVSGDRATRATVARSFADEAVDVIVPSGSDAVLERIERGDFDAAVIDAGTVADVPGLVDDVETATAVPTFVHWTDDGSGITVPSETVGGVVGAGRAADLATAVVNRLDRESAAGLEDLVGSVERRLADARSPSAVERAIREPIADGDRFRFAWVGEYDPGERQVVPWVTDVGAVSWPLQRTFAIGDGNQPLLERAMHAGELQIVERVDAHRDDVPLGADALERGSTAMAVAPLEAGDDLYGVLVVYGDEAITDDERTAIESIAVRGKLDQQERALHRYERLVETAGDGMYVLDEEGHFTTVNEALLEMTGYRHEGLLGERVSVLFDAGDSEAGDAPVETLLESEATTDTVEAGLETKGGETIPCEIRIAALSRGETYRGSVGVVWDVTDRKRRERRLEEQNERLDAFTRIVSHDLRNPLGVAQGYVDLLAETESLEHLENVRNGLDRMETIVDDVLAITREGRTAVNTDRVDLAAADAWSNVSTASATLDVEDTLEFDADRTRLLRLFENLYRNGVEHGFTNGNRDEPAETPRDGLTVRVGPLEGESTGFYVADDGRGLPEQIRETAFDSTESSLEAFGLGLWIVEEIAVGHGWSAAATESVDGGARFEFEIEDGQFSD